MRLRPVLPLLTCAIGVVTEPEVLLLDDEVKGLLAARSHE